MQSDVKIGRAMLLYSVLTHKLNEVFRSAFLTLGRKADAQSVGLHVKLSTSTLKYRYRYGTLYHEPGCVKTNVFILNFSFLSVNYLLNSLPKNLKMCQESQLSSQYKTKEYTNIHCLRPLTSFPCHCATVVRYWGPGFM